MVSLKISYGEKPGDLAERALAIAMMRRAALDAMSPAEENNYRKRGRPRLFPSNKETALSWLFNEETHHLDTAEWWASNFNLEELLTQIQLLLIEGGYYKW